MYALSWIFLAAAIGALAFGLWREGLTFIYASIGASVVAMLFLLASILRKRPVRTATAGAPYGPTPEEAAEAGRASPQRADRPPGRADREKRPPGPRERKPAASRRPAPERPAEPTERAPAAAGASAGGDTGAPTAKKSAARKPSAEKPSGRKKAAAKKAPAKKAAAARPSPATRVVAIPERGTYHESDCRFVKGRRDTERLQRSTAKRRGYSACGVCKPG